MVSTTNEKSSTQKEGASIDILHISGATPASYIPEGFDSVEDFLKDMRENYQQDLDFDKTNREAALDDKKFSAGEQWDKQVLEQRKGLPCLVINSINQFNAQVVGDWREGRKAIKVIASNDEDSDIASIRGDLIRSIELSSRAERVYSSCFESLIQCGDGAFRVSVEYSRDDVFDQDVFIRPIEDCHSVVWDRFSIDPTGRDARRVFVDDKVSKEEFKRKWPEAQPNFLTDLSLSDFNSAHETWIEDDSYRVTEYWRLIQRKKLLGLFENGRVFELNKDNLDEIVAENGDPVKTKLAWCSYAQMHLVTGFAILSGPYEYAINRLPIIRMSGRVVNIGGRRVRYGLVRFMKDPARLKNFWRSIAAEQLGYAPKAQWLAPASAVEGREDTFRKAHLSRDPLLVYNDDTPLPPQRIDPPIPQAALLNEAQVNAQDMKDVTGIHDASLGIRSNETSGRAIQARQREGDVASITFFDNANAAVLEAGDVINQLIPHIYDGTRVIRTLGEDQAIKFVRINDPMNPESVDLSVGMFDVALSTGVSYSTRRVEAAQAMMEAIQVWPQLMETAGDLVVKAQDWPGAEKISERLKKIVPPALLEEEEQEAAPVIDPAAVQEMQNALAALQEENKQLKADKTIEFKKLEIDSFKAETDRIKALSDHEVDATKVSQDAIKTILTSSLSLDKFEAGLDTARL